MDAEREVPVIDYLPWLMKPVPSDVNDLTSDQKKCVDQIADALRTFGCFKLRNSNLDKSELDATETLLENFFRFPIEKKKKYKYIGGNQFGYVEVGNTSTQQGRGDMVEAFIVVPASMEENNWPEKELPGVSKKVSEVMTATKDQFKKLVLYLAVSLNQLNNDLVKQIITEDSNKFGLRINYYPSSLRGHNDCAKEVLLGDHADDSFLTIVSGKQLDGLQVLLESGEWVDVACSPGDYFVNAGTLLTAWTAGEIPAVKHRVIKSPERFKANARMSLAFYILPGDDVIIENIYSDPKYPPISVKEFFEDSFKKHIK